MGVDAEIGSLRPGKWADVIVVSPRDWTGDPVEFLVTAAEPADVRMTFVAGRLLSAATTQVAATKRQ
jgi:cytosine/adenosine deaminase-related metal-dependent hydrolase